MTKEQIQAFTLRVAHANKTSMIVILYDITITYLEEASNGLRGDDKASFRTAIDRARATINELIKSVDTSVEPGMTILRLYIFASGELTKAFINYDEEHIMNVRRIIEGLKSAYVIVCDKDKSPAVMGNSEKIYAGYTYGPTGNSESISDADNTRGYLV